MKSEINMPADKICNLFDELDDRYAVPFLMCHLGHAYEAIGRHLGLPVTTVKERLHSARKLLREMIIARNQMDVI